MIGHKFSIAVASGQAEMVLGRTASELQRKDLFDLVADQDHPALRVSLLRLRQGLKLVQLRIHVLRPDPTVGFKLGFVEAVIEQHAYEIMISLRDLSVAALCDPQVA